MNGLNRDNDKDILDRAREDLKKHPSLDVGSKKGEQQNSKDDDIPDYVKNSLHPIDVNSVPPDFTSLRKMKLPKKKVEPEKLNNFPKVDEITDNLKDSIEFIVDSKGYAHLDIEQLPNRTTRLINIIDKHHAIDVIDDLIKYIYIYINNSIKNFNLWLYNKDESYTSKKWIEWDSISGYFLCNALPDQDFENYIFEFQDEYISKHNLKCWEWITELMHRLNDEANKKENKKIKFLTFKDFDKQLSYMDFFNDDEAKQINDIVINDMVEPLKNELIRVRNLGWTPEKNKEKPDDEKEKRSKKENSKLD